MLAKIMIVIEIQIFFPFFSFFPRDFYHFIAGDGAHHGSRASRVARTDSKDTPSHRPHPHFRHCDEYGWF